MRGRISGLGLGHTQEMLEGGRREGGGGTDKKVMHAGPDLEQIVNIQGRQDRVGAE